MKNFLKTGLYFFAFAIAGILFQISCSNADESTQNTAATNKIIYTKRIAGVLHIFTCNYDGSSQTEIPIVLPAGFEIWTGASQHSDPRISPDGQKIFFLAQNSSTDFTTYLFAANIDGSGAVQIVDGTDGQIEIGNVN